MIKQLMSLGVILAVTACTVVPKEITNEERQGTASNDLRLIMEANAKVPTEPMTLSQALARGVMHNMEFRVRLLEEAVAEGRLDISTFDMLMQATVQAGYRSRTNEAAAFSRSVLTGRQTLEPSTSQEKDSWNGNATLSWNLLDFGVSYLRARQNAERVMIARERKRKATHILMQDIRFAYWRAVAAQKLEQRVAKALSAAEKALETAQQIEKDNLEPSLNILKYQESLLEIIRQLDGLYSELKLAKTELKTLLNMPTNAPLLLNVGDVLMDDFNFIQYDVNQMEDIALSYRPELFEADYMNKILSLDVRRSMLQMLPGVTLSAGGYFDTNDFTYNNNWGEFGAFFSWNLVDLATGPKRKKYAKLVKSNAELERLALSVAVISQVRLANENYLKNLRAFEHARNAERVSRKISDQIKAANASEQANDLQMIRAEVNAIFTTLRQYQSYAIYQNSLGRLFTSLGLDPVPDAIPRDDVDGLANEINNRFSRWERGQLPTVEISR